MTLLYQRYLKAESEVAVYAGLGPTATYDTNDSKDTSTKTGTDTTSVRHDKRTTWRTGAAAVLGAEFFATEHVSIHAEYVGYLRYTSTDDVSEYTSYYGEVSRNKATSAGWTVGTGNVRFGLSAYF